MSEVEVTYKQGKAPEKHTERAPEFGRVAASPGRLGHLLLPAGGRPWRGSSRRRRQNLPGMASGRDTTAPAGDGTSLLTARRLCDPSCGCESQPAAPGKDPETSQRRLPVTVFLWPLYVTREREFVTTTHVW